MKVVGIFHIYFIGPQVIRFFGSIVLRAFPLRFGVLAIVFNKCCDETIDHVLRSVAGEIYANKPVSAPSGSEYGELRSWVSEIIGRGANRQLWSARRSKIWWCVTNIVVHIILETYNTFIIRQGSRELPWIFTQELQQPHRSPLRFDAVPFEHIGTLLLAQSWQCISEHQSDKIGTRPPAALWGLVNDKITDDTIHTMLPVP